MDSFQHKAILPIVQAAGDKLREQYGNIAATHKSASPVDVVTELDKWTEKFIAERLQAYDSSIGFFGEEFGGNNQAERYWLLDPIDGTAHFVRGNPFCTIMLALVEEGQVTFSAIHNIATSEMFVAEKGKGSFRNGEPIHVSNRPLNDAYLAYEINSSHEKNVAAWLTLRQHCIVMATINSGYESGLVAMGKIDGRLTLDSGGGDWDFASTSFLISEAGGVVRNIGSSTYDFRNHSFFAGSKEVYKGLQELNIV